MIERPMNKDANLFDVPILFLIFNRPETTHKVFSRIREVKPRRLFIAADGPRKNKEGEEERCLKTRNIVLENIDWECEVKTLLREENLGCGKAVSEAIGWFFTHVEEGIILEDDTYPDSTFFSFCEILLDKYRFNEKVFQIGGCNFQKGNRRGDADYYFSIHNHIWGWATWKRAWNFYDYEMKNFNATECTLMLKKFSNQKSFSSYWLNIFDMTFNKKIDTWDYQWTYSVWKKNGLTILPQVNLITNIGYGEDATHTTDLTWFANLPHNQLTLTEHPSEIKVCKEADEFTSKEYFLIGNTVKKFIKHKMKKVITKSLGLFGIGIYKIPKNEKGKYFPKYQKWMNNWKVNTIIDVGANTGQFAKEIKHIFPNASIFCIEPIPDVYKQLKDNLKKEKQAVSFNLGLAQKDGEMEFYENAFSQSSSVLKPDGHEKYFPETKDYKKITVKTITADKLFEDINLVPPILYKIDVQGFELQVLKGSEELLKKCDYIKIELSFVKLYENQALFNDVYQFLISRGFKLVGFTHIITDVKTGLPLQVDGYFQKK